MAPFGDVALALDVCRAASGGAGMDVVRPLVLDAVGRLVPAEVTLWVDVDLARGRTGTDVARPGSVPADVLARYARHVADHPAVGSEGLTPAVHRRGEALDGHQLCLSLPAPTGHRAGVVLRRSSPFTGAECARLGRALPAVACAVQVAWRAPVADSDVLTTREVAVLRSVATGMSDKQAARALGVSPRTVGKHLEHIYAKLGVAGRTEAAVQVWRRG
jgi:DNA-binding CsgD family transcriptional regulator